MNRPLLVLGQVAVSLAIATQALGQGVSILNPLARQYELKSFVISPPQVDGWREIASAPDAVRLVYAERLDEEAINTRADFTAQSFDIEDPSTAPDPFTLARVSLSQRLEEKGDSLVALSQVQRVPGDLDVYEYALVVKVAEQDVFEHYFVALAPDKSEYLAAKLITKDSAYREEPYFEQLHGVMGAMEFEDADPAGAKKDPESPKGGEATSESANSTESAGQADAHSTD